MRDSFKNIDCESLWGDFRMKLKTICNIALFVLCVSGIVINYFFEQYKILSIACLLGIGVIAIIKERVKLKDKWEAWWIQIIF